MKLNELVILSELERKDMPDGIYVGLHFDEETKNKVKEFLNKNKIPNPVNPDDLHMTLLYSRKPVDISPRGPLNPPLSLDPVGFEIFPTKEGNNCLVARFESDDLVNRHNEFLKMGGTSDYPEFKPHVTLSYNSGDFDHSSLDYKSLGGFVASEEYSEPLNLNWTKDDKK